MAFDPPLNTAPIAGRGMGKNGVAINQTGASVVNTDAGSYASTGKGTAGAEDLDGKEIVLRRHTDWSEHQVRYRFLMDSYEGGNRYRNATYGPDRLGLPLRNLLRHKREYPDPQTFPQTENGFAGAPLLAANNTVQGIAYGPYAGQLGADPYATAYDSDYEMRRARVPVREFVREVIGVLLSKIYEREVSRHGPDDVTEWWKDVDGKGTPIDDWMREVAGPLVMAMGCLDVCFDRPAAPPGAKVVTRADELRLGLDRCVASYILPQNMVWYRLDSADRYEQCLVREYVNPSERKDLDDKGNPIDVDSGDSPSKQWQLEYLRYRFWDSKRSVLFNMDGSEVIQVIEHNFGRVPITRLTDLTRHRTPNVGKSRFEEIAELQREHFNRDSEMILSDTLQAHPFLSGAEDFCKSDNTLSVGPGYVLPMKKNPETGTYQGWEFVSPPKGPADSLHRNKQEIIDRIHEVACLAKPAGAAGTGAGTVSQSGLSKQIDMVTGNSLLRDIAQTLARNERQCAEYATLCLRAKVPTQADRDQTKIGYPGSFELRSADQLLASWQKLQAILSESGATPRLEEMLLRRTIRTLLPGLSDDDYAMLEDEAKLFMQKKARLAEQAVEMSDPSNEVVSNVEALEGPGSQEQAGGSDPTGESAGTMVGFVEPAVM